MPITLTLKRAEEESGLSLRTLQYAIARGDLQSVRVGRRRLIPVDSLRQFLLLSHKRPGGSNVKRIKPAEKPRPL
jgi:excisionase family DNA binding protein